MNIPIYQIDAFTDTVFSGNPAAVCPLQDVWPPDSLLQNIAMENNLSETAFYICKDHRYYIRWFTPTTEVDLCGHATLASAHVLFTHEKYPGDMITFESRSGRLLVKKENDFLTLNFPADTIKHCPISYDLSSCFEICPVDIYKGITDYMFIYENEDQIQNVNPKLLQIASISCRGIIVTAKGTGVDFVCRFFAPQSGIDEDPVTGSAYTTLMPYWSKILQKKDLIAKQLSMRGGYVKCTYLDERIEISGKARTYMAGTITVE